MATTIIRLSLNDEEYKKIKAIADSEKMTIQELVRYKLLSEKPPSIFTPEEAERRALEKFTDEDVFTLPDVYGEEWQTLSPRMTGVFGKRFFNYLKTVNTIEFKGMTADGRRATYRIKKLEENSNVDE